MSDDNKPVRTTGQMLAISASGPLPLPQIFGQYPKNVQTVILDMAQKEQTHRHEMDREIARGMLTFRKWGQAGAWSLVMTLAGVATYALFLDHAGAAAAIVVSGIVPAAALLRMARSDGKNEPSKNDGNEQQLNLPLDKKPPDGE